MVPGSDLLDGRKKRPFADVKTHPSTSTSASKPGAVLFSAWRSSRQRQRRSAESSAGPSPPLPYVAAHEFIDQRTLDYAAEVVARMRQRQAHRALAAQYDEEKHNWQAVAGEAATQEAPATQEELAASDAWAPAIAGCHHKGNSSASSTWDAGAAAWDSWTAPVVAEMVATTKTYMKTF